MAEDKKWKCSKQNDIQSEKMNILVAKWAEICFISRKQEQNAASFI